MATEATLARLREAIHNLAPAQPAGDMIAGNALALVPVASGIPCLDQLLALGGLPAGRVSEISGPQSSGKTGLGLGLLAEQTRAQRLVAAEALARAAEIIVRSRAFAMVLIDLPPHCQIQHTPARRLRAAAQATGTTVLALSSRSGNVEGYAARIEVSPCQALGSKTRRTQARIVKGGIGHAPSVEFACKLHRFAPYPPSPVAPVLRRALPGDDIARDDIAGRRLLEDETEITKKRPSRASSPLLVRAAQVQPKAKAKATQ